MAREMYIKVLKIHVLNTNLYSFISLALQVFLYIYLLLFYFICIYIFLLYIIHVFSL